MLRAFIDGSTSHREPKFLVLAGYIAPAEQWAKFSDEWQRVLDMRPRIDYFKLKEAVRQPPNGQFNGFSRDDCNTRIALFRGVIEKYCSGECAIAFGLDAYKNGYVKNMLPSKALKNPFCFAQLHLTTVVAKNLTKFGLPRERIDFVFDNQDREEPMVVSGFKDAARMQKQFGFPSLISDIMPIAPIFADDQEVLPLQAADMLATICRRHLETEFTGKKLEPLPGFSKKISSAVQIWNEKQLRARALKDKVFCLAEDKASIISRVR